MGEVATKLMRPITTIIAALIIGTSLVLSPVVVQAQSKPEFILNASAGKITPKSSVYFLDSILDDIKLMFKFSATSKLNARWDIADEKIVEMKQSLEENNLAHVTAAAANYKKQATQIEKLLSKPGLVAQQKEQLNNRVNLQDSAFVYLFSIANEKSGPIVHDAWSSLQNVKRAIDTATQ